VHRVLHIFKDSTLYYKELHDEEEEKKGGEFVPDITSYENIRCLFSIPRSY
jgi:hypothetical protein